MKSWWLGFPRLRCPHCGKVIEGIKFSGRWKLPRVKRNPPGKAEIVEALAEIGPDEDAESKREEGRDP